MSLYIFQTNMNQIIQNQMLVAQFDFTFIIRQML